MDENSQAPETQQPVPQQVVNSAPQVPQVPTTPPASAPVRDRGLEMVIPINRSGWSIAAGYVALFNIPFIFMAPIGIILGLVGLNDLKKNPTRAGRGRCWFAIIYGILTVLFIAIAVASSVSKNK